MSNTKTIANEENKGIEIKEEKIVDKYTMKFWKKFDTEDKPRVMRGLERISKDVVDEFQSLLAEALICQRQELEAKLNKELPKERNVKSEFDVGYEFSTPRIIRGNGFNSCLNECKAVISRVFKEK